MIGAGRGAGNDEKPPAEVHRIHYGALALW